MALKLVSSEYCPCTDENVAQYILDSASDAANLPESCTGSTAMVAADGGEMYMVNASGEWKELASGGGGSSGGGAEVKTCNVRFVSNSMWSPAYTIGYYAYTKYENGKIETVRVDSEEEGFDITLENVVCGSILYFPWSDVNGMAQAVWDENCMSYISVDYVDGVMYVHPDATDCEVSFE